MLKTLQFIIKRASGACEAFSLVMKTNNCLRLSVLTRNTCLYLADVSSSGVRVLNWHMRPELANMSSPRIDAHVFNEPLPLLGMRTRNHAPTIPCSSPLKAWMVTVVWQMPLWRAIQRHLNKVHTRNCSSI